MPYLAAAHGRIHYQQSGQGPNLVLLHGLGGNLALWHFSFVTHLRSDYTITTYDLRGHGRSDMPPEGYTTRRMALDLKLLLDELGIEKAHLLGHSFGADICLHFALLYPERVDKLIIIDAMLPIMLKSYRRADWPGWRYWAELVEKIAGVKVPPEKWQDVRHMMTYTLDTPVMFGPFRGRKRRKKPITTLLTETSIVQDFDIVDELTVENISRIAAPTLLIYETESPFVETFTMLQQELPQALSLTLPPTELKHFSPLQQPAVILAHSRAFLVQGMAYRPPAEEDQL